MGRVRERDGMSMGDLSQRTSEGQRRKSGVTDGDWTGGSKGDLDKRHSSVTDRVTSKTDPEKSK